MIVLVLMRLLFHHFLGALRFTWRAVESWLEFYRHCTLLCLHADESEVNCAWTL